LAAASAHFHALQRAEKRQYSRGFSAKLRTTNLCRRVNNRHRTAFPTSASSSDSAPQINFPFSRTSIESHSLTARKSDAISDAASSLSAGMVHVRRTLKSARAI